MAHSDLPLETVLHTLEEAILCVDDDQSTLLFLNDAAATLCSCPRELVLGAPVGRFPALAQLWQQLCPSDPGRNPSRTVRQLQLSLPGREVSAMEAVFSTLLFNGKKVYTAVIRDLSRQRQMERALYEARKTQALGGLAGGIAHDFNNILTAVISQLDLVLHAPQFSPELKDHLIYAQTSARRGAELVAKLQGFSRQDKPEFAPVDLADVIEQAVFVLRRSVDPRVQVVGAASASGIWRAKADANQIGQALLNLGLNARDAMPDGGRLTFSLQNVTLGEAEARPPRRPGEFVQLVVADTGHGMTAEVASRVFEPYFTTKDLARNQGLGLFIVSAVVAEHAGWIEVESRTGGGSAFSIFLPRSTEPAAQKKKLALPEAKAAGGRETILIVDDEELVRLVTKAVLTYRGYQVIEAEDGEAAVAKYHTDSGKIDLVLMDMHMPRLNGYDALQRIRQLNPQAKAILLSGGVQTSEECIGGMDKVAFLHKPFENEELVRLVRQLLDAR